MLADLGNPDSMPVLMRMLLQQYIELKEAQNKTFEKLEEVRDSVVRLEAAEFKERLDKLQARIDLLEDHETKRQGVVGVVGWLSSNAPWLATGGMALLAYFGWNRHP